MKWFGLTGGIASGKSTVAQMLRQNGYPIVDADIFAREVVAPGTEGFNKIVKVFGRPIVQGDGTLNRRELGKIIFNDIEKRIALEGIIHPLVQARAKSERDRLQNEGHEIAFYDVPLLFEKGLQSSFDAVVVVACSSQAQLDRLIKRDNLSRAEASSRIASQLPMDEKSGNADFVIWNDGSAEDLKYEVDEFLKKIH